MATTTFHEHNGNGSQKDFTYTFPTYKESEVKVEVNHVAVDNWTVVSYANSGTMTVRFDNTTGTLNTDVCESDGSPKSGTKNVLIYRETDLDAQKSTYQAGASVKAGDLNTQYTHSLRGLQDNTDQQITTTRLRDGAVTSAKIRDDSIVNADINSAAEIEVSKLKDGAARQVLQTAADGNAVEWTSNVDIPGTLDVTGAATLDSTLNVSGTTTAAAINASGAVGVDGNFDVNTNKFTVASSSGNTTVAGTLGVTGTTTAADINSSGAITADGNVTFKGDVTLDNGTNAGKDLTWDASDNALEFKDNVKAHFGDSNDLQIYHDGSHSYVKDAGEGSLRIQGSGFSISDGGSNTWIGGAGAVTQLWAGSNGIKLETSSTGVTITGETKTTTLEIGGTDVTASATELNILDGKSFKTSSGTLDSTSDTEIPSSKVINTRIVAVADQIGGFVPVADKDNFPTSNPDPSGGAGTVVSISDATGISVNSSGVGSLATRAGGSDAVIINGFPSAMRGGATHGPTDRQVTNANPYIIPSGVGLLVQTTSTPHTYDYHKVQPTESDIVTLNDTVEDFQARYRLGSSNPGSANNEGDLFFNTTTNKMLVYNGSAWADISATGNYFTTTLTEVGDSGDTIPGGSATFDGTAKKFGISLTGDQVPSNAFQITVSLNGVIQKPNSGTTVPSEGFAWDDTNNWLIFADAVPASTPYFIVVSGSQVNVTTVQDNEVGLAQLEHLTEGDILVYGSSGTPAALGKDAGKFLKSNSSGAPSWETVAQTDTTYTHTWQDSSDDAILRLTAGGSGSGNDDLKIVAGSNITLTPSGDDLTIAATDTNTQLTTEQVQDIVGGMVTGNTETGITVTYDDTDGTLDFSASGTTTFLGLTDTPSSFTAGKHLKVNSGGNALELTDAPSGTITALNNQTADRLTTIGATTTELDGEASLTFNDAATTGLISARQATARGFECPATVSDDWTIAAGNNAMFPGPMTVAAGKTVTVPATRTLHIL